MLEKEKYTSYTTACLLVFTHVFCHMCVEILLKGTGHDLTKTCYDLFICFHVNI